MRRIGVVGQFALLVAVAACAGHSSDGGAPSFAGIGTATIVSLGTAHLEWAAASGGSAPIDYEVYLGDGPTNEDFTAPIGSTKNLSVDLAGLPASARPDYFVVRARGANGNEDANKVEASVTFLPNRLSQLAQITEPDFATSDIAVNSSANLVAMGGFISSPQVRAYLFNVSTAANPTLVNTLYGPGRSTDVEISGNYLYVSTEDDTSNPQAGVYIYDISNPASTSQTPAASITGLGLGQCHTIWIDGTILYCASSDDFDIHLLDISNPLAPLALGQVGIPGQRIHDMYVQGSFAVGCFLDAGWAFFDVSDPLNPVLKQRVTYDDAFTHNAWPTADQKYLYTTDELSDTPGNPKGGHLRIWDIHDHDHVTQVGEFLADPGAPHHAIVHNVKIVAGYAWVSWYEAGVLVLDVSDPVHPALVGSVDTWAPTTQSGFDGIWGVAPVPPLVYVSGLDGGLYVMKLADP